MANDCPSDNEPTVRLAAAASRVITLFKLRWTMKDVYNYCEYTPANRINKELFALCAIFATSRAVRGYMIVDFRNSIFSL